MKNKKGFTLIELLAVIIILAVIALIAVPQVLKILNKARLSAAEDTVYGIVKSAETYVSNFMLKNRGAYPSEELVFNCNNDGCLLENISSLSNYDLDGLEKLEFKGMKPKSGKVIISNNGNNITMTDLFINNFVCGYIGGESICIEKGKIETKENGTVIYFNPETTEQCNDYVEANSDTNNKRGCMKWYIFNDSEESAFYNLLLDHNTTAVVGSWEDVAIQLSNDIKTWNNKLNVRSISLEEVFKITGKNEFDNYTQEWYYFDTLSESSPSVYQGEYGWLFDRTSTYCTSYGCANNSNIYVYGYWTGTKYSTTTAWNISCIAVLHLDMTSDHVRGVRPVISVPKNKIS